MKLTLIILTIIALFQPLFYFYVVKNEWLLMAVIPLILGLTTLTIVVRNFKKKHKKHLIWSSIVLILGFITANISIQTIYVADALLLMSKREEIVRNIKQTIKEDTILHVDTILPIALDNNVTVKISIKNKNHYDIVFPTLNVGFLDTYVRGVVYSDSPEELEIDKRTNEGGLIYSETFKTKFIKEKWYFYDYHADFISD